MKYSAGLVGLGYWGPNLARNLAMSPDFDLVALCDRDPDRLARYRAMYPLARCYDSLPEMLAVGAPNLLVIATPVATHFPFAKAGLEAGCHVLVEKPLAATTKEAEELLASSKRYKRTLFVDHTFLFTGAVAEIKKQFQSGALGDLMYVDSVRINLGLFQPDVNVIWDLAPHDVSILNYVIGRAPESVRAIGSAYNPSGLEDVAYLHLDYGQGVAAHLHLSWRSPVKIRRMFFAGTKQSLIYDDLEPAEKIKIYDHGVAFDVTDVEARRQVLVSYRRGEMRAPAFPLTEALAAQMTNVAAALRGDGRAIATGLDGLNVVRTVEAACRSLQEGGTTVRIA